MAYKRVISIIGVGPRGGFALENLIHELKNNNCLSQIQVLLFEATGNFGNGQVYETNQPKSNWINITERNLNLEKRDAIATAEIEIPSFPSYHEWASKDYTTIAKTVADTFPPRASVGEYLQQRFNSFITPLVKATIVSVIKERVVEIQMDQHRKLEITTHANTYTAVDEVLLTIGHQPTKLSEQIAKWNSFAATKKNIRLFKSPYPITDFLNDEKLTDKSTIGIRGFGLAMIDVVRGIALKFGEFIPENEETKSCKYQTDYDLTDLLIPFSLDGLPPAPKPLNAEIDDLFKPTDEQLSTFEKKIGNDSTQKSATSPQFLIRAFAPIAAKIYSNLPEANLQDLSVAEIEDVIEKWLNDTTYEHPILISINQSAEKTMQDFVDMATGKSTVSLDYCVGQVWRHCQPTIYTELSYNACADEVFADIIALDEKSKRYSYGPPVESIQQLLALVEAEVMNLEMVNNPTIELSDKGWNFELNGKTAIADIMIDSVLDAPKIEAVDSPIIKNMLSNDLIEAVHDDLGVATDENGYVISSQKNTEIPIAVLGRLAKGTIIGVDAILECFGTRPQVWATEAVNRHLKRLQYTI
ncbi:FAD/NAD(P)-binding protein [Aurantibacter crassamenti]|uniref:FAD/NAD(P)-binding protein n=1 Tax=Aurantibacter crassamenti TaxID=1837375 RepID=UPI00193A34DB|nr:FAD/NAD(P)-binding protein [Aurantibacter crassamenti]MBM1104662.1 FAD/NAD(P)-binding protein [Aurantibacter crassamenti]